MSEKEDVWAKSAHEWDRHQSPYQPHPDDTAVIERVAAALVAGGQPLRAVILGVTQETASCDWPAGTKLTAIDSSQVMIDTLWSRPGAPAGANAICAGWTDLPFDDSSVDLVTADGSLACLDFPDGLARLLQEVRRVLKPNGRFVVRTFIRPDQPESLDAILGDLDAGRFGGPYPFKLRFSMSFHEPGLGVSRRKWREGWYASFPDEEASARRFGWSLYAFAVPNIAESDVYLYYPTRDELRTALAPHFAEVEVAVGSYELAERCPTLVLAPIA
jgi:SAM-dependent methyltransferase